MDDPKKPPQKVKRRWHLWVDRNKGEFGMGQTIEVEFARPPPEEKQEQNKDPPE